MLATDTGYLLKPTQPGLQALAIQLEDEGLALPIEGGWLLTWGCLYRAIGRSEFGLTLTELGVPEVITVRPVLASSGALTNRDFSIAVKEWLTESGQRTKYRVERGWPLLHTDAGPRLMNFATWRVHEAIIAFLNRPGAEKTDLAHRQSWGRIRQLALDAHADLSDFLRRSVVVTPERLRLDLRRANVAGVKVLEVAPTFEGAPEGWLDAFDRQQNVPDRYDIATRDGIVQVLVTAPVRNVLREVKRLDRRREIAGARARGLCPQSFRGPGRVSKGSA